MPEIPSPRSSSSPDRPGLPRLLPILILLAACGASDRLPAEGAVATPGPTTADNGGTQEKLPPPGEAWVIFDKDTVGVELARTPEEREKGLMYREALKEGRGMLFIFQDAQIRSFWMANTLIPLDIAYLDENLRIIDIQTMEPQTETAHPSARPAMFALEVPQGWFTKTGIRAGAQARLVFGPG